MCVGQITKEGIMLDVIPRTNRRSGYKAKFRSGSFKETQQTFYYDENSENSEKIYREDIMAVSTHYTKLAFAAIDSFFRRFENSTFYKILCHTTQPAHVVAIFAVSFIAFSMYPSPSRNYDIRISPLWTFVYLGSFSLHFGAQIWMTFVSGLALYFNVPRHTFGTIQKVLFPKYFLLNAVLSFITLSIFLRTNRAQMFNSAIAIQVAAMTICFLVELLIRLYATPSLLVLIEVKNEIEKEAGVGMEVGKLNPGSLLECPHYMKIHKAFRKLHMTIAMGNMVAMTCTILHLHYLASKICSL